MAAAKKKAAKAKPATWALQLADHELVVTTPKKLPADVLDILERVAAFAKEQCALSFQAGAHTVEHSLERAISKLDSIPPPPVES